ncbi:TerB family tellurite resistance protein [Microbacteriaceae bacterium K1510]|nr:TerB family tellurite resistance protein [Microbacteriaceae bacterium K1510]
MFEAVRKLIADLTEDGKHPSRFEEDDYRVAAAALLVHTAAIDGNISPSERTRLHEVIKQRFELDDETTDELVAEAIEADEQAIDLYHFTARLNRSLDERGRARLVEMMWQIVFADGAATEFEDNLIWRAADLLHVPREERIALRERVSGLKAQEEENS